MKYLLLLVFSSAVLNVKCQIAEIGLDDLAVNSGLIVEGKVIGQTTHKHAATQMIYTVSKLKVYKVFKGKVNFYHVEIFTAGGAIGNEAASVSEGLELKANDIGIFFLNPHPAQVVSPETGNRLYDVYGSSQGFIKYDMATKTAASPFNRYKSIGGELYPQIEKGTGTYYITIDPSLSTSKKNKFYPRKRVHR